MKRRNFLKISSIATGGLLLAGCGQAQKSTDSKQKEGMQTPKTTEIGIQLYTVRDLMKEAPIKTLEALSKIGYNSVENAGYSNRLYYGMKPHEFKKVLEDNGLAMHSNHFTTGYTQPDAIGTLNNNFEALVEDAAIVGHKYLVLAWLAEGERKTLDDYKKIAEKLAEASEIAQKSGIQLAYHNHDFEYTELEGQLPIEILFQLDPDELVMELDLYWATFAGTDPLNIFEKYPGRFHLWHVKDMKDRKFTEVGSGEIPFDNIFAAAQTAGMRHFYVEQDSNWTESPMQSAQTSFQYIQNKLV